MKRSPWGKVEFERQLADGIVFCNTAGHGGIHLNAKRQRQMPAALRNSTPWYEEDCEVGLVFLAFPDLFPDRQQTADRLVRDYFPDQYEAHLQCSILPGHSDKKDEKRFEEDNRNNYVVTAAWADWHKDVPKDHVAVVATIGGGRDEESQKTRRYFLVSADEYKNKKFGFVVDLTKHKEIEPISY